jgi:hypothetical protein
LNGSAATELELALTPSLIALIMPDLGRLPDFRICPSHRDATGQCRCEDSDVNDNLNYQLMLHYRPPYGP